MASKANQFLKKTLGEDFFQSLQKVEIWKPGTKTTVDHEELGTALQIVPRTVMALLIRELSPMAQGETKEVHLFVGANAKMRVSKHERDVYSGVIEENNKQVVEFKFRSIPGIGLVILSAFELYDMDTLKDHQHNELTDGADAKIQKLIDEKLALHALVNQVVEQKLQQKEAVHSMVLMRLTEELQKTKEELERERIRLAGAGAAALGYAPDIKPGDYAHSASLDDARRTYEEKTKIKKDISEVTEIAKQSADSDEYLRGMANGLIVADSIANNKHDPEFVEAPKKPGDKGYTDDFSARLNKKLKGSPLKGFLENREKKLKKNEFSVELAKGENVNCPDCGKNIFDGKVFSGCICLGDDMEKKLFVKKTEDGIKVRFGRGWDRENMEMLLEVLRRKK